MTYLNTLSQAAQSQATNVHLSLLFPISPNVFKPRLKMASKSASNTELTIAEIEERYANQWIVIEETAWEDEFPVKGVIITHSIKRETLTKHILRFWEDHPTAMLFTFYAGCQQLDNFVSII